MRLIQRWKDWLNKFIGLHNEVKYLQDKQRQTFDYLNHSLQRLGKLEDRLEQHEQTFGVMIQAHNDVAERVKALEINKPVTIVAPPVQPSSSSQKVEQLEQKLKAAKLDHDLRTNNLRETITKLIKQREDLLKEKGQEPPLPEPPPVQPVDVSSQIASLKKVEDYPTQFIR